MSWPAAGLLGGLMILSPQVMSQQKDGLAAKVEKIFVARCFECHAGEAAESSFRLDVDRPLILTGGDSGQPAVVPGDLARGSLLKWITSQDPSQRMPPEGEPLSKPEIQAIQRWIAQDAPIQGKFERGKAELWSFQPLRKTQPAANVRDRLENQMRNPVDVFISNKLAEVDLQLGALEDRTRLIRRIFLVTLGVPPTAVQVREFVNDPGPGAYQRLVERVLSSTAYGERWAQHWLDIIRFGETEGFETNRERPNAWPFRDYVIESLNEDKPYDQFVQEQIAGDQLGVPVATGYIVAGSHDIVGSPDINLTMMQRQDELADIVNVTGTTFLGLTIGCARCHNHKFDPITQSDFYSMQAIFAGIQHGEKTLSSVSDNKNQLAQLEPEIATLEKKLEKFIPADRYALTVIDDEQVGVPVGIRYLVPPAGKGTNPLGKGPGQRDDPGSLIRSANRSGGRYSWWTNVPGKDLAIYSPSQTGRHRIWLSWGCGHKTHCRDAIYELDQDGNLDTRDDRQLLATVDQTRFADGTGGIANQSLWSGFKDVGVHTLEANSVIVLRGGKTGTVTTTDTLVLQPSASDVANPPRKPHLRPAVNARHNVELFPEIDAKRVRFTISASSQSQPCLDELEIFSAGKNVALASSGAKATSGGDFKHPLHKLAHINDGQYGNPKSWIAEKVQGWVQIELPAIQKINRIQWARDRSGQFSDRVATGYRIEISVTPGEWIQVSSSADRLGFGQGPKTGKPDYDFSGFPGNEARQGMAWASQLEALKTMKANLSRPVKVYAGTFVQPGPTHRLYRGDPFQKREQVEPDTIEALGQLELGKNVPEKDRRVAFARWLTAVDNPLLARVIVNRVWQHTFGQGIVATPNDFGNSGRPPTHPGLLDWLAGELMDSGWSLKHVHRVVLSSQTFRQSSRPTPRGLAVDAGCQYLWRFPPRRLEAETIRDSILAAAGVLDHQVGGKGFDGFEIQLENVRHFFPKKNYGPADWRRMIYMTKVRQERDSVFGAFDCPDASQVIDRRSRSTTPLQSLNLLNSSFVLQQAELMAKRLEQASVEKKVSLVEEAYRVAYSRKATAEEINEGQAFIKDFGIKAFCRVILNSNEFLFIQ